MILVRLSGHYIVYEPILRPPAFAYLRKDKNKILTQNMLCEYKFKVIIIAYVCSAKLQIINNNPTEPFAPMPSPSFFLFSLDVLREIEEASEICSQNVLI